MPDYDYTVTVTARNRAEADKLMSGLNTHPFKCGPPFKSAAVLAAYRAGVNDTRRHADADDGTPGPRIWADA